MYRNHFCLCDVYEMLYVSVCCLQIVQRYDIVLIQEVRDSSETVIDTLINEVNANIGYISDISCYMPITTVSSYFVV